MISVLFSENLTQTMKSTELSASHTNSIIFNIILSYFASSAIAISVLFSQYELPINITVNRTLSTNTDSLIFHFLLTSVVLTIFVTSLLVNKKGFISIQVFTYTCVCQISATCVISLVTYWLVGKSENTSKALITINLVYRFKNSCDLISTYHWNHYSFLNQL